MNRNLIPGFFLAQLPFRRFTATIVFSGRAKRGDGYREVVQRDQGVWVYSTRQRRQGRVCAHLCRGESRPEQPQRGCQGELRRDGKPRQNVCGKSKNRLKALMRIKPASVNAGGLCFVESKILASSCLGEQRQDGLCQ